ncbi:MAG: integrase core domain-containing protein [Candidatus Dormibacteraeota bacterium]|nr:integrase core domain-containing protein [Candidatus Dormibacteraeota bacterium]
MFRLLEISLRQVLHLLLLRCRSSRSKDLELLVLHQELDVLRRQVPRPRFRPEERLVLTVVHRLRPVRERLSRLVTPDTLRRWHRDLVRRKWHLRHRITPRRRIPDSTRAVVLRFAPENPTWGYRRIQGELRKLGSEVSATSIRRILAAHHSPRERRETWSQFMRAQASSIIACDLFTVESIRLRTLHVLFFIDLHTRCVLVGGITAGPASVTWCAQAARSLTDAREDRSEPIRFLVHDRDRRFGSSFNEVFCAEGIEIIQTPWRSPRANAYAERFIRTVRSECLDRLLILGEGHLRRVLDTYVDHYNHQRPHRGRDLHPPDGAPAVVPLLPGDGIGRRDRLGGLIHEYYRKAA